MMTTPLGCLALPLMKFPRLLCEQGLERSIEQAPKLVGVLTECFLDEETVKMKFDEEADR